MDSGRDTTVPVSSVSLAGLWRKELGFRGHVDSVKSGRTTLGVVLAPSIEGSEPSLGNPYLLSRVNCGTRRGIHPKEVEGKLVIGSTGVFG